jgi:predicted XRE-type DNA-binding protein
MRFVLARGEVDTAIDGGDIARMDGPVFHRAAEMMMELKGAKLMFAMSVGDEAMDDALSVGVNMLLLSKARLTERQWGAVTEYERTGSQAEAAEVLGVSQQAISHALVSSDYRQVRLVEKRLNRAFGDYARRVAEAEGRDE